MISRHGSSLRAGGTSNFKPGHCRPSPELAARVHGVDLAAPPEDGDFEALRDAFHEHAVLVPHDPRLFLLLREAWGG